MGKNYKWKRIHELKAYLAYRKIKELSEDKDFKDYISFDSILMRVGNSRSVETGNGLTSISEQNHKVFEEFKGQSIQNIKEAILDEKFKEYKQSA